MGGSKPHPPSLCWDCANTCTRGCSWADTFTPVAGWIAARHDLHVMSGGVDRPYESYIVLQCPAFERDAWMGGQRRLDDPPHKRKIEL